MVAGVEAMGAAMASHPAPLARVSPNTAPAEGRAATESPGNEVLQ
jgi:hypothetical protein